MRRPRLILDCARLTLSTGRPRFRSSVPKAARFNTFEDWTMDDAEVIDGVFAVDKPAGRSSFAVVSEVESIFRSSSLFQPLVSHQLGEFEKQSQNLGRRRQKLQKRASRLKVGHGGTLDPMATGVLVIGVGSGTKALDGFLGKTIKTYDTTILFGTSTDTYDTLGSVLLTDDASQVTESRVVEELAKLKAAKKQTPPLYSALHMDGKRLYEYAREGKPLPRTIPQRDVNFYDMRMTKWLERGEHRFRCMGERAKSEERELAEQFERITRDGEVSGHAEPTTSPPKRKAEDDFPVVESQPSKKKRAKGDREMEGQAKVSPKSPKPQIQDHARALTEEALENEPLNMDHPAAEITLTVSSGAYVRSVAHDLGIALGSHGVMAALRRTRQGRFTLDKNVLAMEDLMAGEEVWGPKVRKMLEAWKAEPKGDGKAAEKSVTEHSKAPEN